jgi:small-conductance mechanosensitive channel
MESLRAVLNHDAWQHPWVRWAGAVAVVLLVTLLLRILFRVVTGRLERVAKSTSNRIDDVVFEVSARTRDSFFFAVGVLIAIWAFSLPPKVETGAKVAAWIICLIQAGAWASRAVRFFIEQRFSDAKTDPAARTGSGVLTVAAVALVWLIVALLALDNVGVDITALVAGLGVGGVAVALATQNILGDLFASVSILLDKPFVVGDFIVVGDMMGTVENIGVKTTRLRSLGGEQLIFANNDLLQARVRNFRTMKERRVVFGFGVTYQTTPEQLEKIPETVRALIAAEQDTRFDRAHFKDYGDSALNFEVVYFVLSPDYNRYMDIQQRINLGLYRALAAEKIEFAYPTRTLVLQRARP